MKEWIGKRCKLEFKKEHSLFYTADIISIQDNIITFKDKNNKCYSFSLNDLIEISEAEQNGIV